jgi:transcriptional antiterminator RfaH
VVTESFIVALPREAIRAPAICVLVRNDKGRKVVREPEPDQLDACSWPWMVVNTKPHREQLALGHLHRQAFNAYCPMVHKQRAHARRMEIVLRPLFPTYIFVQDRMRLERWRPILSTQGVRTILRSGSQPTVVENGFISYLKALEADGAVVPPETPTDRRMAGDAFGRLLVAILDTEEKDRVLLLNIAPSGMKAKR